MHIGPKVNFLPFLNFYALGWMGPYDETDYEDGKAINQDALMIKDKQNIKVAVCFNPGPHGNILLQGPWTEKSSFPTLSYEKIWPV